MFSSLHFRSHRCRKARVVAYRRGGHPNSSCFMIEYRTLGEAIQWVCPPDACTCYLSRLGRLCWSAGGSYMNEDPEGSTLTSQGRRRPLLLHDTMPPTVVDLVIVSFLLAALCLSVSVYRLRLRQPRHPPGPRGLPLFGNLFQIPDPSAAPWHAYSSWSREYSKCLSSVLVHLMIDGPLQTQKSSASGRWAPTSSS